MCGRLCVCVNLFRVHLRHLYTVERASACVCLHLYDDKILLRAFLGRVYINLPLVIYIRMQII